MSSKSTAFTVGPYSITEQIDGIVVGVKRPWGYNNYRYYFEAKQNCEPREILPNCSAVNVKHYKNPLLGKYNELYYTNKHRLQKESVLAELKLTELTFD